MKGFIREAALILGCAVGVAGLGCATSSQCTSCGGGDGGGTAGGHGGSNATIGCSTNKDLYDPCYPARYENLARRSVNLAFTPQVQNGHVLDQTIWNHHFEPGTDRLTQGGLAQLQYVSRRRPTPDTVIYLATANDLQYDPCCPERYAGAQSELNSLRLAAIQKYLVAINAGRPVDFQVALHDPADVSITSGSVYGINPVTGMLQQFGLSYRGFLAGGSGGGSGGTAGPSGSGISQGGGGGGSIGGGGGTGR